VLTAEDVVFNTCLEGLLRYMGHNLGPSLRFTQQRIQGGQDFRVRGGPTEDAKISTDWPRAVMPAWYIRKC
jgi:hypothetical protein